MYIFVLSDSYDTDKDKDRVVEDLDDIRDPARESIFNKGQSKRIWNELFKVRSISRPGRVVFDPTLCRGVPSTIG